MFEISNNYFKAYVDATQNMLTSLGVDCNVYYAPLKIECENCYINTMPGISSSKTYKPGGPYPFTTGQICPYCEDLGYKIIQTTEIIRVRAYFERKSWPKMSIPVGLPDNSVWTIGYLADLIKIKDAAKIIIPFTSTISYSYVLFGEPIPWGLKRDRYFSAFWERN